MCQSNICTVIGSERRCTRKLPGAVCRAHTECASNSCIAAVCQCSSACKFSFACPQGCALPKTCIDLPAPFADYCGVKQANGKSCRGANECVSGICSQGVCTQKQVPGTACTGNAQCASSRCVSGVCQCSSTCVFNPVTCAQGCALPQTCINVPDPSPDYCGVRKAVGESCGGGNECASGNCSQGFCTLKQESGTTCTSGSQCASNRCICGASCIHQVCECSSACAFDPVTCAQGCATTDACRLNSYYSNLCVVDLKQIGEACEYIYVNPCAQGVCTEGICTYLTPGVPCTRGYECSSGGCTLETCDDDAEAER